jgi:hypothetical protein
MIGKTRLDGFLLYLFGVVVKILHREDGLPNFIDGSADRQFSRFAAFIYTTMKPVVWVSVLLIPFAALE